jgi:hypothetical protein
MPEEYHCSSCKLAIYVGWYHLSGEGDYPAVTNIACGHCGTMHSILHGVTISMPEDKSIEDPREREASKLKKIPDILYAVTGPFTVTPKDDEIFQIDELLAKSELEWREHEKLENVRPHRKVPSCEITEGAEEELCFDHVSCKYCGKSGNFLVEGKERLKRCPRCGLETLEFMCEWMT